MPHNNKTLRYMVSKHTASPTGRPGAKPQVSKLWTITFIKTGVNPLPKGPPSYTFLLAFFKSDFARFFKSEVIKILLAFLKAIFVK